MDQSEIEKLVCKTCWQHFFSTHDFWEACKSDPGRLPPPVATHRAFNFARAKPSDKCNWCAFIKTTCQYNTDDFIDVKVSQSYQNVDAPLGRNHWQLQTQKSSFEALTFTDADDNCAAYVTARPVQTNVSTQAAFDQVRGWLGACESHGTCAPQHDVALPTRVIAIPPRGSHTQLRILSTKGARGRYTALSYCWGRPQAGCLTERNFIQYSSALILDDLSQTIREAIEVTRNVGVDYLWVDALCIIQDSELDKAREISVMDQIYSNALFTIAVASAAEANQGFLGPRKPQSPAHRIPFRCPHGGFGTMFIRAVYDEPWHVSHLDERAWTFQEEVLSSRLLIYDLRTLSWSCKEGRYYLGSSYGKSGANQSLLRWISSGTANPDTTTWMWIVEIVGQYSSRKHSVAADKLAALSAVAKFLAPEFGCVYLAGLWLHDLPTQLLWHSGYVHATDENSRPTIYRAPSWSWAAIDGPVWMGPQQFRSPMCTLVRCETQPKYPSAPFAEVVNGSIVVEGYLRGGDYVMAEGVDDSGQHMARILWDDDTIQVPNQLVPPAEVMMTECSWWFYFDTLQEPSHGRAYFLVIMGYYDEEAETPSDPSLRECTGLVLRRLTNDKYQRLGTFETRPEHESDIGDPPICRITIV